MNLERMRLLHDVMVRIETGEIATGFDMTDWKCGTAFCAAGHLCQDPRAQAQGLHLSGVRDYVEPEFEGLHGMQAMAAFLGTDVTALFDPLTYPGVETLDMTEAEAVRAITPRMVINRIEDAIAKHKPPRKRTPRAGRAKSRR